MAAIGLGVLVTPHLQRAVHADDEESFARDVMASLRQLNGAIEGVKTLNGDRAREIKALEGEIAALKARLRATEVRTGLVPFAEKVLKPLQLTERKLTWIDGVETRHFNDRGKKKKLQRHLKGFDGAVISFWATWCVPCTSAQELAHLARLQTALRREGATLVSISVDTLEKVHADERAPRWVYPYWQREDAHLEMLPRAFVQKVGVGLPLFLVVTPSGEVHYFLNTALTDESVEELVDAVIGLRGL